MNDIKIESNNFLEYKKGYTPAFIEKIISERNLDGLNVFDLFDRLDNVEFLKECTFLKKLSFYCSYDQDYSFLLNMPLLTFLNIGASIKPNNIIDLSNQVNLENLTINWRKGKVRGLENCKKLENICIWSFQENDFSVLKNLTQLKSIDIRTSSVKTLEGLEKMISLENLLLGYCRSLTSIKSIIGLPKLNNIVIESCTKIEDYDKLEELNNLETLELINVKEIKSVQFATNLQSLKKIVLTGSTDVLDGNLKYLKNVKEVIHNHKKHYIF